MYNAQGLKFSLNWHVNLSAKLKFSLILPYQLLPALNAAKMNQCIYIGVGSIQNILIDAFLAMIVSQKAACCVVCAIYSDQSVDMLTR